MGRATPVAVVVAALAATAPLLAGAPAAADPPPRGAQAYDCRTLAASAGPANVWWTSFSGDRRDVWDQVQSYRTTACFLTEADCKAWLYWTQSDFPDHMLSTPCRHGQ